MAARDDASPGRREEEARELDAVAARVNEAPSNQDDAAREHEDEAREDDGEGGEPKADRADGNAAARDQEDPFMTTPINSVHRTVASLKLPVTVPALITYAQGIVKGMTRNATLPTPSPSLPTVTAAINDLQARTTVTGLIPVSTVQFRYCAVTQTGQGDWSAPVSLLVK